jgi:hypothetical protein
MAESIVLIPAQVPIKVIRGDDLALGNFTVTDDDDVPVNLGTPTITFIIKQNLVDNTPIFSKNAVLTNPALGVFTIALTNAEIDTIESGTYPYFIKNFGGTLGEKTLMAGNFDVIEGFEGVTPPL